MLIVGEMARHGRIWNREIIAVAGTHTDRVIRAVRRTVASRIEDGAPAEQRIEEATRAAGGIGGGGVLRSAIILRQLAQHGAPLIVLIVGAALELLQIAHQAVEVAAHLLDLRRDRPALRRQARKYRENSLSLAALFVALRAAAVEIGLL